MKTNIGILNRHAKEIAGVLGCFDRLVITGTLAEIAHPDAMDARLFREDFRAMDIGKFAEPLRARLPAKALWQRKDELPQCSDLFGADSTVSLRNVALPEPDGRLLVGDFALIKALNASTFSGGRPIFP